jgi:hypothetical protein
MVVYLQRWLSLFRSLRHLKFGCAVLEDRLAAKTLFEPNTGCWIWLGSRSGDGYGRVRIGSRKDGTRQLDGVHRIGWMLHRSGVPDGKELDHICRVRACWNPDHLKVVTHQQNMQASPFRVPKHRVCKRGHPFTPENTGIDRVTGRHRCRRCAAMRARARYYREQGLSIPAEVEAQLQITETPEIRVRRA